MEDLQEQVIIFPGNEPDEPGSAEEPVKTEDLLRHRRVSLPFLFVWLALMAFGFIMMFSASFGESFINSSRYVNSVDDETVLEELPEALQTKVIADATATARRQLKLSLIGSLSAIALALGVSFRQLLRPKLRLIVYIAVSGLLIYTKIAGPTIQGAQRWVTILGIQFQSSEFAKIAVVYCLSTYFYDRYQMRKHKPLIEAPWEAKKQSPFLKMNKEAFLDFSLPVILILFWLMLIVLQPHLSGAIIITVLAILMFVMGKIPLRSWLIGFFLHIVPLLLIALLIFSLLSPAILGQTMPEFISDRFAHSQRRIDLYRDRESVDADGRRQIEQAEIAFGVGGLTGVGLGRSTQKLNWLAEAHNDFIFPIIGEELGLVGTLLVLLLFLAFLICGLIVAGRSATLAARNMAAGFSFLIVFQAFLNMAVATSLIPATGISLPFFSAGGTANIIFAFAAGTVLCISKSGVKRNPHLVRILDNNYMYKSR